MTSTIEFCCPQCSSSFYETDLQGHIDTTSIGFCKGGGRSGAGCTFTWNRKEDWKVFAKIERFESADEYADAV